MVVPYSWPALEHLPADVVVELGRERPGADPGRVGLGDPPDLVDVGRPDAGADRRRAGDRVRGGDERIGAVVEVEQGRLGALEDDRLAGVERVPAEPRGVGDVGLEPVAEADVLLDHRVQVEARVRRVVHRLVGRLAAFAPSPASLRSLRRRTESSRSACCLGSSAARILVRRIFSSSRSWTRIPSRSALSA